MQVLNAETVALIKQQVAGAPDSDKVVFEGNVVPRAEANAEIERRQVQSRHTYFDPQDLVGEFASPHLKYKVRSSMAWSIDNACITAGRNLFYGMNQERAETIDDFNEFISKVAEVSANESYNVDLGFEENTGNLQLLSMLLVLRRQWHDSALTAAKALPGVKYEPASLEALMAKEKQRTLDEDTLVKTETLAKMACRRHPDRYEATLAMMLKAKEARYKKQHEGRKLTAPAIANLFTVAEYRGNADEVAFHQLADELQLRLINGTKSAVERALEDLAEWKGITSVAYAQLCAEGFDALDDLEKVIAVRTE